MKRNKFTLGLLSACAVGCLSVGGALLSFANTAGTVLADPGSNATESIVADSDAEVVSFLENVHKVGDVVDVPTLTSGGAAAAHIVYDADGNAYTAEEISLDRAGVWSICYLVGNTEQNYDFIVYPSLSTINGSSSTVNVGKASDYLKYDAQGRSGIVTNVAFNESVTFNEIIDLTDKTRTDKFLTFSVFPETLGTEDAGILVLTFSDIEDESNTFQVHLRAEPTSGDAWNYNCVYVRTGAGNQDGIGLRTNYSPIVYEFEGEQYAMFGGSYGNQGGTHVVFSMRGYVSGNKMNEKDVGRQEFSLAMDYETKRLFCYANNNNVGDNGPFLLNDFASADLHGENVWAGFKSGKCKLTVSAKNYVSTSLNMMITKLGDKTEFDTDYIRNETPASIELQNVDMNKATEAVIGKAFTLPQAVAYDAVGNAVEVQTRVYTGYQTGTQTLVKIEDGRFIPTQRRDYTIEYSAMDDWGNQSARIYMVSAVPESEHKSFSLRVDTDEAQTKIGQTIAIKQPKCSDDYVGRYVVSVEARLGSERVELGEYTSWTAAKELSFAPQKAGRWMIVYRWQDLISEGYSSYILNAEGNGVSYFTEEASLPRYVIVGANYSLPDLYGYDYSGNEGALKKADVYVTTTPDYSSAEKQTSNSFVWSDATTEILYCTYVLNDAVKQYTIPVIDVGYGTADISAWKYFRGYSEMTVVGEEKNIAFTLANQDGAYKLAFANKLLAYNFKMQMTIPTYANYSRVNLYLTDVADTSRKVKISYVLSQDGTIGYALNDGSVKPLTEKKGEEISLEYSALDKLLTISTQNEKVLQDTNGNKWTGFEKDFLWLELEVEGVQGTDPKVIINGLNNQRFYAADSFELLDLMPEFYKKDAEVLPLYEQNATMTLPEICAADVFSVGIDVVLSVFAPSGSYATDVNGTILNKVSASQMYTLQLKEYGYYTVTYTATDDLGRINKKGIIEIRVEDIQPPTVELGAHSNKASLNDVFVAAKPIIKDNYSAADQCNYSVYVICPDYDVEEMSLYSESGFRFTKTGKYTVLYYVEDEAGNVTMLSYDIYVS